ncbi:MAG TPA: DUF2061 domain-containing protein [Patescibacteria group bacterium]
MDFQEKNCRSFVKALTFRITIMIADFFIVFAITRRYDITIGVMLATNFVSTLIYYGHERIWNGIGWGKGQ